MSSLLDLTLVVQLVNFACAYWILSKFFLRPAYSHLKHIQLEKKQMQQIIQGNEHELSHERQSKKILFADMQQELKASFPVSSWQPARPQEEKNRPWVQRVVESKKELINEVAQKLKQWIINE